MMATILNSAILDSAILHKTLTQTNSIWLKLIHYYLTWWWQPSWCAILNLAILDSASLVFPLKLTHTCQDWFPPFAHKKTSLIFSDSTWWRQPSWILPCWIQILPSWIQTPFYLLSDSLKNTLTPLWLQLKLIQSDKLDDASHLEFCWFEFCHLGLSHFAQNSYSN